MLELASYLYFTMQIDKDVLKELLRAIAMASRTSLYMKEVLDLLEATKFYMLSK